MVPANFQRILALPEATRDRYDLSSLKLVAARGGARARCRSSARSWTSSAPDKVWEYYGASEGGGTVISPAGVARAPGQRRQAVPGQRVRDPRRRRQRAAGGRGRHGVGRTRPASSFEYHNDPEKTAASHRDGFFTVGDAGYLDADGYLYLTDRKSDMVITGGVNIYPARSRSACSATTRSSTARCSACPTTSGARCSTRSCSRTPGSTLDEDGVVAYVREHMADYKRPRIVEFVDELPRDPNGKVRKPKLREAYLARSRRRIGGHLSTTTC